MNANETTLLQPVRLPGTFLRWWLADPAPASQPPTKPQTMKPQPMKPQPVKPLARSGSKG